MCCETLITVLECMPGSSMTLWLQSR